ncbi:MAG: hypothetical protein E7258_07055 [Lachnospiraceae bacterium]|nr:hypothetical protein [Lachnospiraceae bacterium]
MGRPIIDGFVFSTAEETEKAKQELESVKKLKRKINPDDIEGMVQVYNKLVNKDFFSTPVGLGFLHDMRSYLEEHIEGDPLLPISVKGAKIQYKKEESVTDAKLSKLKKEYEGLLSLKKKLVIAVVALVVMVVGMFFIIVTNDNLGYFNAEEKVLNKYSAWQERLQTWEEELIQREDLLEQGVPLEK